MNMKPDQGERGPRVEAATPLTPKQSFIEDVRRYKEQLSSASDIDEQAKIAAVYMPTILDGALAAMDASEQRTAAAIKSRNRYRGVSFASVAAIGALVVTNVFGGIGGGENKPNEASAQSPSTPAFGMTAPTSSGAPKATKSGTPQATKSGTPEATKSGVPGTTGGVPATTGGAPTRTEAAPVVPNAVKERKAMLERADSRSTVARAVATMRSTPETIKRNIRAAFNQSAKSLDHGNGSMSSLRTEYGQGELGPLNSAEAVAYSSQGSPAYAAMVYNALHNVSGTQLPNGVSNEEALASIEAAMTAGDTKFAVSEPSGTFMNHGQRGEDVFAADEITLNNDTKVFTMTTPAGKKIRFKIENRCLNILDEREQTTPTPVSVTPETVPQTEVVVHKKVVQKKVIKIIKEVEKRKHKKKTQRQHTVRQPKHDSNNTPAGVPGHNGGTPDNAGNGPAGQPVRNDGFVEGEGRPTAPAPATTPAQLPNGAESAPPANGQQTGVDGGSGQSTTGSTVTGETPPTSDPNPQG